MNRMPLAKAKQRLATLWITGAGIIFAIVFLQTVLGHYGDFNEEAWAWLLPTIMPTLSLIVGVLVADAFQDPVQRSVNSFTFRLSYGLSAMYLITVLLTFLLEPISGLPPLDLMKTSNLWLGPFQGLVSASLGVFFMRELIKQEPGGN